MKLSYLFCCVSQQRASDWNFTKEFHDKFKISLGNWIFLWRIQCIALQSERLHSISYFPRIRSVCPCTCSQFVPISFNFSSMSLFQYFPNVSFPRFSKNWEFPQKICVTFLSRFPSIFPPKIPRFIQFFNFSLIFSLSSNNFYGNKAKIVSQILCYYHER